jgi:hypothetical protein
MSKIHVLHENSPWVEPLRKAFSELGQAHEEWFLDTGVISFSDAPPDGVFYNRMSASSHTRGHRYGPELTHGLLNWLEGHDRRVVNGTRALYLELSKLAQYAALERDGIKTPRTVGAVGRDEVLHAAASFSEGPWILKPNRGGKGLGVQLFHDLDALAAYLDGPGSDEEAPIDGLWLIQDYIHAPESFITRAEFVGGKFLYAVRVDTSQGFELCPADACNIADAFCPAGETPQDKFSIITDFAESAEGHGLIASYERFLANNRVEVAGIEFIRDRSGGIFTYDINTNTNYNAEAEEKAGVRLTGMRAISQFLVLELLKTRSSYKDIVAAE